MRAPATRGLQSQAALVSAQRIESCEQSPSSGRRAVNGACFWGLKTSISGFVAVGPHCAQQKTCCRIGGWNHHSGHRAIILCDNCTPRSAIVFLTPGQLAGQMHAPRIHFKEHMHTEKTRLQHQIWPQKTGSIFGPTICSLRWFCWAAWVREITLKKYALSRRNLISMTWNALLSRSTRSMLKKWPIII